MRGYRKATLALAAACALGVTACGGDDEKSTTDGSASAETVKIMALGPIESSTVSLPSIEVGAQVAVDEVNAAGGIDGKQLELVVCNDENDPNTAVGCARQAVKDGVAAIVGGFTAFEPQVVPIVERAGIPWVGPTALQNSTSKSYFLLGGEGATLTFAMGLYLDGRHCSKISAIAENLPSSKAAVQLFQLGVAAGKGTNGDPVYGATNAADWGPVVAAASGKGADCVSILGSIPNTPKIVGAIAQSGKQITTTVPLSLFPAQAVAATGKAADGVILTSGYLPLTSDAPAVKQLVRKAQAMDAKVPLDGILESTYASVKVLAEAAKGLPTVDAKTLMGALGKLKGYDTGLGPVVDFTASNPTKLFSRVVNTKVFLLKAQDGKIVLAQPQPLDTAPAFAALAAAGK